MGCLSDDDNVPPRSVDDSSDSDKVFSASLSDDDVDSRHVNASSAASSASATRRSASAAARHVNASSAASSASATRRSASAAARSATLPLPKRRRLTKKKKPVVESPPGISKAAARGQRCGISANEMKKLMRASWPVGLFNLLAYIVSSMGNYTRDLHCVEYFSGVAVIQRAFVANNIRGGPLISVHTQSTRTLIVRRVSSPPCCSPPRSHATA